MKRKRPSGVRPSDSVLEAAERIFQRQYLIFASARDDMLADADAEALHDMRVSSSRLRSALRLFRPFLSDIRRGELNALLSRFRRKLGTARDWEVWIGFLSDLSEKKKRSRDPVWMGYVAAQRKQCRRLRTGAMRLLAGDEYEQLKYRIESFLGKDLARLIGKSPGGYFACYAAGKVRRGYRRLLKTKLGRKHAGPEEIHEIRKRIRRLRYWTEFAAPAIGAPLPTLAKRLKALTTSLGDAHDMDVYLERIGAERGGLPVGLAASIERRRSAAVRESWKAWKHLREAGFRKKLLRKLKDSRHKEGPK